MLINDQYFHLLCINIFVWYKIVLIEDEASGRAISPFKKLLRYRCRSRFVLIITLLYLHLRLIFDRFRRWFSIIRNMALASWASAYYTFIRWRSARSWFRLIKYFYIIRWARWEFITDDSPCRHFYTGHFRASLLTSISLMSALIDSARDAIC